MQPHSCYSYKFSFTLSCPCLLLNPTTPGGSVAQPCGSGWRLEGELRGPAGSVAKKEQAGHAMHISHCTLHDLPSPLFCPLPVSTFFLISPHNPSNISFKLPRGRTGWRPQDHLSPFPESPPDLCPPVLQELVGGSRRPAG